MTTSGDTLHQKLPLIPATALCTGGNSGNLQATNSGHLAANKNATRPGGTLDVFTAARDRKVGERGFNNRSTWLICLSGLNHYSAGVTYVLNGVTKQIGMGTVDSSYNTHSPANNRT